MPTASSATSGGHEGHLEKFQDLLRELFQFDCADLDFGIYRIMNHKREVVERFIAEDLPKAVDEELSSGLLARQALAQAKLEEARQVVLDRLGEDAIDGKGEIAHPALAGTPVAREYLDARERAGASRSREAVEADVYNHLTAFFSRYYEDGDFVSRRRYSRKQRYAIPYNGEEVYLHWANADQYYVKTGEHFRNYDWKAPNGVAVRFRVKEADVEQDNVKGERRFFLPSLREAAWDQGTRTVTVPFAYRPLSAQEKRRYGGKNQQEKIIAAAVESVPEALASDALAALSRERRRNGKHEPVSYLEHHLRRYTRRNDSDFFIHRDLRGFLARELDFYLKNEVLNLDDLAAAGEFIGESWFQELQLIRAVGGRIIDFLAQIEDFQKLLWEKRKFVTEANWCVAMRCVPEDLLAEVAENEAQWEEWRALGVVGDTPATLFDSCQTRDQRLTFLRGNPTLMLDTAHFGRGFLDGLLSGFEDLDGVTDGVLFHSENWQALALLREKYAGTVQCAHIDPPYNTGDGDFLYKDGYRSSSWLAMMLDRLRLSWELLRDEGSLVSHIDEHEYHTLEFLMEKAFGGASNIGPIIWDKRNPKGDARGIGAQHEYLPWFLKDPTALKSGRYRLARPKENAREILAKAVEMIAHHGGVNESSRAAFRAWICKQPFSGGERAYRELDDEGAVFRSVSMAWPNKKQAPKEYFRPLIHPKTGKPCPVPGRGWRNPPATMDRLLARGCVLFGEDETIQPTRKYKLVDNMSEGVPSLYYFGGSDDALQENMGFFFSNPKPVRLAEYVACITLGPKDLILDFFAGSGTTAHAVIGLNREDNGGRKFILVEMGEYFDTVLLPRVKKVAFSPEWRNGKPAREATAEEAERSPRLIKYMRLESYEDALDSIGFDEQVAQLNLDDRLDGYFLNYMLKWETKDSETLLNPATLASPFAYRLRMHRNGTQGEQPADVAETFN